VVAPIEKLRELPHGDGAFAALSMCCGLFERLIDSFLKEDKVEATPKAFREAAAEELGCSEEALSRFWDGYRLGMQHAFQPKSYVQDAGRGDRWGWEMAEGDVFHRYPEIIKTDSHAFILRIDPWKFVNHVLERWRQNPELMNALSEFALGDIASITERATESADPSTYSSRPYYRTYYEGPVPPSVTGIDSEAQKD
jgi:hypothetical protein